MKKIFKPHILIPVVLALSLLVIFGGWWLLPSRPLSVTVLDKTVPASTDTSDSVLLYRKHYGLYWMLDQLKYTNPADKKPYNYLTDYYGTTVDANGSLAIKSVAQLNTTPDLFYISDVYGPENASSGSAAANNKGLSYEDIAAASTAHTNGSTLIAESDVFSTNTEKPVQNELQSLFGVKYTTWAGRYFPDMSDLKDVPDWAQTLYESQYGRKWNYKGPGILLASDKGELVVLEKSDFSGSMLTLSITSAYQKEFGARSVNYYNWFVIVTKNYNAETIAEFHLNLNASGMKKFSSVSDSTTFPAVVRVKGTKAPAYFFAGDFNDYVANKRYPNYLLSAFLYQFFSYDKPGDITYSYWNFYYPLMKTILQETESNKANVTQRKANTSQVIRISNSHFEIKKNGTWKTFDLKGFNINAVMAGSRPTSYTRDISVYRQFIAQISKMGGNCIRVYDLLPPEFYRALYEYNLENADDPLYFMQSVATPDNIDSEGALSADAQNALKKNIEYIINAVHGNAVVPDVGSRKGGTYITDVSPYLAGFIVETDTSAKTVAVVNTGNAGYTYAGKYISSTSGTAAEGLIAMLCDYTCSYQQTAYGFLSPVGAEGNAALAAGVSWSGDTGMKLDLSKLTASDKVGGNFFLSYGLQPDDAALLNNSAAFASYKDDSGSYPYGGYIHAFKQSQSRYPVLIDRFGLSTNTNAYEKETSVNGLTETEQGKGIVRMLKAIKTEGFLGGLISDYNDNWSESSSEFAPLTLPSKDNALWQNTLDPAENSGVTAMEPTASSEIGLSLKDNDLMTEMQISSDASYVYLTILFNGEIDYDKEQLIIGIDTYQRNNGEYRYDPKYFATSLSGMEFVIKFESKNTAAIYVVPSYDRNKGNYSSKETYAGIYDYICQLNYGSFESGHSNFYQSGSTIHLRLPWSLLNFTDPTKKMVINDTRSKATITADPFGIQTTTTDGILFSLLIADKTTKDTLYIFPISKQSSGYKTFKWDPWTTVDYVFRQKESCKLLSSYFLSSN